MYKSFIRPILFSLDPETAHEIVFALAGSPAGDVLSSIFKRFISPYQEKLQTNIAGIEFANPIGLAAGFDKNCRAVSFFDSLGFGHLEIGTITGEPQPGNPRPRITRLPNDEALINAMGFPSLGAEVVAKRLAHLREKKCRAKIGVNIGKTKVVSIDDAAKDYLKSFTLVSPYADYVAINVSSPNTPDLRRLQEPQRLKDLFLTLGGANTSHVPLFVKIAPDLSFVEISALLEICLSCSISGIIACNTSLGRDKLVTKTEAQGGLSGKPIFEKNLSVVSFIHKEVGSKLPIIGVGGISSIYDVIAYLSAGASLVQIYTSMIYEGPFLVKTLIGDLSKHLRQKVIG